MKSINLIVLGIAVLASLAFVLTMQEQYAAAFNDRNQRVTNGASHSNCGTSGCDDVSSGTTNTADVHFDFNCNTHRDSNDPCISHSNTKP